MTNNSIGLVLCKLGYHKKHEIITKHSAGICFNTWYECSRCDKKSILSWASNGIKSFKGWKDQWEVKPEDFKSWAELQNELRQKYRIDLSLIGKRQKGDSV